MTMKNLYINKLNNINIKINASMILIAIINYTTFNRKIQFKYIDIIML